ncbi:MAG: hypothetical protein VB934_18920, partial [Polyangiaceae bacterium]
MIDRCILHIRNGKRAIKPTNMNGTIRLDNPLGGSKTLFHRQEPDSSFRPRSKLQAAIPSWSHEGGQFAGFSLIQGGGEGYKYDVSCCNYTVLLIYPTSAYT